MLERRFYEQFKTVDNFSLGTKASQNRNNKRCVKFDLFCDLLFMGCTVCNFELTINHVCHDVLLLLLVVSSQKRQVKKIHKI